LKFNLKGGDIFLTNLPTLQSFGEVFSHLTRPSHPTGSGKYLFSV